MRPFARYELEFQAHRLHRQQQVGEDDGCVYVEDLYRLEGHGGGQIGPFTYIENARLRPNLAVLFQVPSRLPHEPDRPNVCRPPAASI